MKEIGLIFIGAVIATLVSIGVNNYWYQDNTSCYIVRGGRIWGGTKLFSFQRPGMGWVKMDKGLSEKEAGVFLELYQDAKNEREAMKKLKEKLNTSKDARY